MIGGEIFVPKIPSYKILDVAKAISPKLKIKIVGIRPGEKIHEEMITKTDSINTIDCNGYYVILPTSEFISDKIKKIMSPIKTIPIKKNMGWCDDPKSNFYNQEISLPNKFGYEKLYRNDNLYDLIFVLNYNINPIIKNKGSAIFIHIAKKNYKKTSGCIALKKKHMIKLISLIQKNTKIQIN